MNIGLFAQCLLSKKGGIERATSRLSSWLAEKGHTCIIYHWDEAGSPPQYPLHPAVKTCPLPLQTERDYDRAKKRLAEDDLDVFCCAISTKYRALFLQLFNKSGIPLLMSERSSPLAIEKFYMPHRDRIASFAAADGIHLLSERYLASLPPFLRERTTVIPNAAPAPVAIDWEKREGGSRKILLAAGRLEEDEKRYSTLIKAFSLLANSFPDWDCRICGEGSSREAYQRHIDGCGLSDRVLLPGDMENMEAEYSRASIFCISSAFEGCPNALLEAQAHGLPSVGFASCGGVNDIIVDGENGFLAAAQTPLAFANALQELMSDAALRMRYAERAQELAARYDPELLYSRWESLLARVAAHKGHTRLDYELLPPDSEADAVLCLRNMLYKETAFSSEYNRTKIFNMLRKKRREAS